MTITNGYTTLADVKTFKRISSTDATDDAVIERMVENASRLIDGETWRRFYTTSSDETREYTARNAERVYTDDIVSITSVKMDYDGDRTYETTLASTDYDAMPDNYAERGEPITWLQMSPLGAYTFSNQRRGIQIVGKFGFCATASVPADIKMCCEEIVINVYEKRFGVNTTGAATITGAGVVITPQDIPDTAWRTINKYKRGGN
jgi:hypothetical protein